LRTLRRLSLIILGAALQAFNINTFVQAAQIIPGGFTGVTLLAQEFFRQFLGIEVPYSAIQFTLNAVPAAICFRLVGKKFTLYSVLVVILSGFMIDLMPQSVGSLVSLNDRLLCVVFGGILMGISTIFCLFADATSGGTDFIAIAVSEKFKKDAWNYIFVGNCALLILAGIIRGIGEDGSFRYDLEVVLYSIIFQFTYTSIMNSLYRAYQQKTMLIVTDHPVDVYRIINEKTNHGATSLSGTGLYGNATKTVLYSVVYSNEVAPLIREIRAVDSSAFINIIKTEQINGRFFRRAKD